jgi:hypothetical protein
MNMEKHVWRPNVRLGLANIIDAEINSYEWMNPGSITDIRGGKEILVACDFGGQHRSSNYHSYAFLLANISEGAEWNGHRKKLRAEILGDYRRISFKGFRNSGGIQVLERFLEVSNYLPGLLIVFVVDKQLGRLISSKPKSNEFPELVYIERKWNKKSFDKLSLVGHIGSLLIGGLCGAGQDILWVTDQDEIAPNPEKHDHAGWVLWYYLNKYAPQLTGKLVFVTTEADLGKRWLEDAVSIADVAAGGFADALTQMHSEIGTILEEVAVPINNKFKKKTFAVLNWLGGSNYPLSKLCVIIEKDSTLGVKVSAVRPMMLCSRPHNR